MALAPQSTLRHYTDYYQAQIKRRVPNPPQSLAEWRAGYDPSRVKMPGLSGKYYMLWTTGMRSDNMGLVHAIVARSIPAIERAYLRFLDPTKADQSLTPKSLYAMDIVRPDDGYLESIKDHVQNNIIAAMHEWGVNLIADDARTFATVPDFIYICHNYDAGTNYVDSYSVDSHDACINCGPIHNGRYSIDKSTADRFVAEYWTEYLHEWVSADYRSLYLSRNGTPTRAHEATPNKTIYAISEDTLVNDPQNRPADISSAADYDVAFFCHLNPLVIPDTITRAYEAHVQQMTMEISAIKPLMSAPLDLNRTPLKSIIVDTLQNTDNINVDDT
jgi:hypothetical protein